MRLRKALELAEKLGHCCLTKPDWMKECPYSGTSCNYVCYDRHYQDWLAITVLTNGDQIIERLETIDLSSKDWIPYYTVDENPKYIN